MTSWMNRRTAKDAELYETGPQERADDEDLAEAELGGWSTGAQANTSTLIRWAAWGLLILGPLLGTAAYLSARAQPAVTPGTASPAAPAPGSHGAAGFAEQFVAAYICAGDGDQDKLAAYYPDAVNVRLEGASNRRTSEQLTVARLRQTDRRVWSVTVAARITETQPSAAPSTDDAPSDRSDAEQGTRAEGADSVRYFQVPVAIAPTGDDATGYVALTMPAEVGAPGRIEAPDLVYGPMRPATPSDPRTQAVTEFLTAYLTHAGELDRYLAPGTDLAAITPAPYTGIAVDQLAIEGDDSSDTAVTVPGDGTTLRLLVTLRATGHDDVRVPLTYALTLKARADRWEIAALDGAPTPARTATAIPTPAP